MAQGFKARYTECVASGLEPDETFREMVIFAEAARAMRSATRSRSQSLPASS